MNARVRELAEQAGFTANDDQKVFLRVYDQELVKFAKLIAQECADICYNRDYTCGSAYGDDIVELFGI